MRIDVTWSNSVIRCAYQINNVMTTWIKVYNVICHKALRPSLRAIVLMEYQLDYLVEVEVEVPGGLSHQGHLCPIVLVPLRTMSGVS